MSKICPSCNTQCQDTEMYCPNCGTRLANVRPTQPAWQPQPTGWQPPQQPQQTDWQPPQQPQQTGWQPPQTGGYRSTPGNALGSQPGYINIIAIALLVVAALNVIFGLVFLIGQYNADVKVSAAGFGMNLSDLGDYVPSELNISDVYEAASEEDLFNGLQAINILYGLALIALAAFAGYLWVQIKNRSRQVPQLFLIYAIGTIASVIVYMLLFHICGTESREEYGTEVSISIRYYFFTWLHLIYAIAVTAYTFVILPKIKGIFTR